MSKLSKGRIMRSNAGGESSESRIRRQNCNRPSEKNVAAFFRRPLPPASGMAMAAKQKGGTLCRPTR
ncbi:MAG: hypothetical protein ACFNVM_05910 [Neisseria elongata]